MGEEPGPGTPTLHLVNVITTNTGLLGEARRKRHANGGGGGGAFIDPGVGNGQVERHRPLKSRFHEGLCAKLPKTFRNVSDVSLVIRLFM